MKKTKKSFAFARIGSVLPEEIFSARWIGPLFFLLPVSCQDPIRGTEAPGGNCQTAKLTRQSVTKNFKNASAASVLNKKIKK